MNNIEIKINKEIMDYKETIFWGLSLRQFVCSIAAVAIAVFLYVGLRHIWGRELVSWFCIMGAAPIAAAGFFQYHGMTLERFLWVWLKSEVLMAGKRVWKSENYYYLLLVKKEALQEKAYYKWLDILERVKNKLRL